jgi:hypothetical protein
MRHKTLNFYRYLKIKMNTILTSFRLGVLFVTHTDNYLFETLDYGRRISLGGQKPPGSYLVDITLDESNFPTLVIIPLKLNFWKTCGSNIFIDSGDYSKHYKIIQGAWVSAKNIPILKSLNGVGYKWYGMMFLDQARLMTLST